MEKQSFFKRTGVALGLVAPDVQTRAVGGPAVGVIPPTRSDISYVSPDVALQVGAVHRAISILTASVAQMDLGVYRDGIELKPSPTLIRQPNINDTQKGFIEETVYSLAAYGNGYWKLTGEYPSYQNIEVLDPDAVTITEEGGRKYWYGSEQIPAKGIRHLKLFRKPGHLKGYGPIQHGQSELIGALRMRNFADNWFGGAGVPLGTLTTDQTLNPEEAQMFAEAWQAFIQKNGQAVLSQGLRYEHLNLKPAEAQFLEVQQAQVVSIARLFGIPAMHLLAELTGTSNTYLNLEQANIVFLQTTLVKYMNEIEEALSSLLPRGQVVQFKEDGLLRMDSTTKWNVIKTQVDVGYTNGDELRSAEGKTPLPQPVKPKGGPVAQESNSNESSEQNGND